MTVYTVRFCGKEFVAYNVRDFARIAVFAKWYLRSQDLNGGLQCSIEQQEIPSTDQMLGLKETAAISQRFGRKNRSPRTSVMRKAVRSFIYNLLY
jgi:hypothetical protein